MNNIEKAIELEQSLTASGVKQADLFPHLKEFGFDHLSQYYDAKREHLFAQWIPEVYYIDIGEFAQVTEDAIQNGKYGIYILTEDCVHAFHGTDTIDYELCDSLGVRVVELNYAGGTIIGSAKDLSILVVFPKNISMNHPTVINKFCDTISKYVSNVSRHGNDILVNGEKVSGSMTRNVGDSFVWAAQVSFADYTEYIQKICNKKQIKKPAYIDSSLLTRDKLEEELIAWLQKK
jgi:hypothetical protein